MFVHSNANIVQERRRRFVYTMKLITCARTPTVTALGHFLSLGIMATTFPKMVFSTRPNILKQKITAFKTLKFFFPYAF